MSITADPASDAIGRAAAVAAAARAAGGEPLRVLVAEHLGVADDRLDDLPGSSLELPAWRHIALDAALRSLLDEQPSTVVGVPTARNTAPELAEALLLTGLDLGPVAHTVRPNGPETTTPCISGALLLLRLDDRPLVLWVRTAFDPMDHSPQVVVDAKAAELEDVQGVFDVLRHRMATHSPFRGRSLKLVLDRSGNLTDITFEPRPEVGREQLVLPDPVFTAIETHAVGVGRAAARLRAAGQHLKRGLLLFGPPGTGKTHTIRYLTSRLPDATLFVLTGGAMGQVKQITQLLEEMAPAIVVLDDIDLIAQDREQADNSGSVLFDLLDAMDGLREDVDLLFVCTSNRAEVLEKAIAARPGRIDQAVHVDVPDAAAREHLLALYAAGLDLRLDDLSSIVERTDGVTASFMKELLRRATLVALRAEAPGIPSTGPLVVADRHLHLALDDLLDPANPLTPALLGIHGAALAGRQAVRGTGTAWCGI